MLATARDIILRLPQADEQRVRIELAGNLCRCTGYMGIVAAILAVLQDLREYPDAQVQLLRVAIAEGRAEPIDAPRLAQAFTSFEAKRQLGKLSESSEQPPVRPIGMGGVADTQGRDQQVQQKGTKVNASFDVPFGLEAVWTFMSDLKAVASCLPGAQIDSETSEQVTGNIAIKFGPMAASFKGSAKIERDAAQHVAVLKGTGQDSVSQSRATGDVRYQLEALSATSTRVAVELLYTLQGPLAQFSRSGLVQEFVRRMVADFGKNVSQRLAYPDTHKAAQAQAINPIGVMLSILWQKIKSLFGVR
jgi:carbon-monoxide dehydrogenase small subunit